MIWDADACDLHLEMLVMQKVLNHENCVILMTFFPIFVILILIWFFASLFSFVKNTDWLSLFGRCDNSCNLILFLFFLQISLGSILRPLEGWQWIVTLWYVTKWNFPDLWSQSDSKGSSIPLKLDDMGWSRKNLYNKGHPWIQNES